MSDTCKNCGAWEGLHHYETNQCPKNGIEATVGRKQEWQSTTYERDDSDRIAALTARAAALEQERDEAKQRWTNSVIKCTALQTELDETRRQLAEAQARIAELEANQAKPFYHPSFDEGDGVYRP